MRVWNVLDYCSDGLVGAGQADPACSLTWRAHVERVTSLALLEDRRMVLTSAADCTVRLWTMAGEFVGTFGQPDVWDVNSPASFQVRHHTTTQDPSSECQVNRLWSYLHLTGFGELYAVSIGTMYVSIQCY